MKKIAIINGPNLNKLGTREPHIYGSLTLDEVKEYTESKLSSQGIEITWFQSNVEGEIVNEIQRVSEEDYNFLVINPAAYSHTSVAIYDALSLLDVPVIEVHLSNTNSREEFRQSKLTAKAAQIIMEGLGKNAYYMGIMSQLMNEE